jgi:ABC-type amino acid transport substrate-binding protein
MPGLYEARTTKFGNLLAWWDEMNYLRREILFSLLAVQIGTAQAQTAPQPAKEIIVATKDAPPFAIKAANGAWTGIGIELCNRVGEKQHENVPEMLAAVSGGNADAAVAAISVTPEREKAVDFTQPFYASGLGIAVPANKEIEWLAILRNIFTLRFLEAIGALIVAAVTVGSAIWLIERHRTAHFSNSAHGFGTGLWKSASAMTRPRRRIRRRPPCGGVCSAYCG